MNNLLQRKRGFLAGLAIISALVWAGQSLSIPQTSASTNQTVTTQGSPPSHQTFTGYTKIAKAATSAVVNITQQPGPVSREERDFRHRFPGLPEWPPRPRGPQGPHDPGVPRPEGMGSGVIVSPNGYILTNNHVVEGEGEITVTLTDKREFTANLIGADPKTDLAVVKIGATSLPFVPWGDSASLQVGEIVLAVGNPFGLSSTVTQGIVSALGRGGMGITQYEDFIQTDAAINPGNSGGALINTKGELVGINTAIVSRTGGYQGIGFAVPTGMAKPIYESLVNIGKVVRGYLGIGIQEVTQDLAQLFGLKEPHGALVSDVKEDSPADRGGIEPGDVVIRYQGSPIENPAALQRVVTNTSVGTASPITVVRDGKHVDLMVKIGEQPDRVRLAGAGHDRREYVLAGLAVEDLDSHTARTLGLSQKARGVVVVDIQPGSGADRAGLSQGDVIREINRQSITSVKDFEHITSDLKNDRKVLLWIIRRGSSIFVTVKV